MSGGGGGRMRVRVRVTVGDPRWEGGRRVEGGRCFHWRMTDLPAEHTHTHTHTMLNIILHRCYNI